MPPGRGLPLSIRTFIICTSLERLTRTVYHIRRKLGRGIGRKIIETLEQDEYFLRAKRIEIPASITGTPFYRKMGYDYKNGICTPDEEGLLRLEKYR